MNEIGCLLKSARETSGVSLEEASADLKIRPAILNNIEEGNMGCFKDIFELKDYIREYSKYQRYLLKKSKIKLKRKIKWKLLGKLGL